MAKLKDFILELNETFANNELVSIAGASAIAEIEVGDDTMTEIKTKMSGLMSIDAAKNNHDLEDHFKKKVYGTIKGELLGNIDTDVLATAKTMFGDDKANEIKEIEFTGDKIKKFAAFTKEAIESQEGGDEKIKTLNVGLNKQVADLRLEMDKASKANDKEIKKLNSGFTEKLINKGYSAAFNSYTLGEKYQEPLFRDALHDKVKKEVQAIAKLTLSDEGEIIPKNPDNIDMDLFIQNKPVKTLRDVMDSIMSPHIKVNNVDTKKPIDGYIPAKDVKMSRQAQELMERRKQMQVN